MFAEWAMLNQHVPVDWTALFGVWEDIERSRFDSPSNDDVFPPNLFSWPQSGVSVREAKYAREVVECMFSSVLSMSGNGH